MKSINFINPVPPKKQKMLMIWFYGSVGLVLALVIGIVYTQVYYYRSTRRLAHELYRLKQNTASFDSLVAQKKQLEEKKKMLEERLEKIRAFYQHRDNPLSLFTSIATFIPAAICLTLLQGVPGKTIVIEGVAQNALAVTQFLELLNALPQLTDMCLISLFPASEKQEAELLYTFKLEGVWQFDELKPFQEQVVSHQE